MIYSTRSEYSKALEYHKKSFDLDPTTAHLLNYGLTAERILDYDTAVEMGQKAERYSPTEIGPKTFIIDTLIKATRFYEAESKYREYRNKGIIDQVEPGVGTSFSRLQDLLSDLQKIGIEDDRITRELVAVAKDIAPGRVVLMEYLFEDDTIYITMRIEASAKSAADLNFQIAEIRADMADAKSWELRDVALSFAPVADVG